jgi:hypothetical protein
MPDPRSLEALYQDLDMLSPTHRALFFRLLRKEGETLAQLGIPRRFAPDAPLSYVQERIWSAGRHAPAGGVDNVSLAIRLDGPLDVDVLSQSFATIADRHEVLRSAIRLDEGTPRLVVSEDWALPFEVVQPDDLDNDLRRRALRPFGLASDPLLRVTLYERSPTDHVLLIVLHQLVSDGLSLRLMLRELSALYAAGGVADDADLPERRVEYADVATWQREWMSEEDLAVQRAYWETQLAGLNAPTRIADVNCDERAAHPSAAVPVTFSPNLSAAVRQVATAKGATSYMTILTGLYAALAAETGCEDLLVASLVSSRTLPETETLLGNFSNTLLLRQHLPASRTFSDALRQVKADVLSAYRHQDYPYVEVQRFVNEQGSRRAEASPYQVLLIVRDSHLESDIRLTGVQVEANLVDLGQTRLPLSIDLVDDGASPIDGRVTYATDLFDASAVETFVERLVTVLHRAVQNPGLSIDALGRVGDTSNVHSTGGKTSLRAAESADLERNIQKIGF